MSDYKNWPQDVQLCYSTYGSWNSPENRNHFDVDNVKINTKRVLKNHQFELLSATTLIEDGEYETDSLQTVTYKLLIGQHTR